MSFTCLEKCSVPHPCAIFLAQGWETKNLNSRAIGLSFLCALCVVPIKATLTPEVGQTSRSEDYADKCFNSVIPEVAVIRKLRQNNHSADKTGYGRKCLEWLHALFAVSLRLRWRAALHTLHSQCRPASDSP